MDRHTREQRSKNMKAIKSVDTEIEMLLRRELFSRGYRYRLHCANLPGRPDIVFTKNKVAIFADSEFWHGYNWDVRKKNIQTNREYWIPKIERNMERDKAVTEELTAEGWTVLRFWGKEIYDDLDGCILKIEGALKANERRSG